jgi:hypothetical protein
MVKGALPLQPKDILVYFNNKSNIIHSACVTEHNSQLAFQNLEIAFHLLIFIKQKTLPHNMERNFRFTDYKKKRQQA